MINLGYFSLFPALETSEGRDSNTRVYFRTGLILLIHPTTGRRVLAGEYRQEGVRGKEAGLLLLYTRQKAAEFQKVP
jgi:hypothetical protein